MTRLLIAALINFLTLSMLGETRAVAGSPVPVQFANYGMGHDHVGPIWKFEVSISALDPLEWPGYPVGNLPPGTVTITTPDGASQTFAVPAINVGDPPQKFRVKRVFWLPMNDVHWEAHYIAGACDQVVSETLNITSPKSFGFPVMTLAH